MLMVWYCESGVSSLGGYLLLARASSDSRFKKKHKYPILIELSNEQWGSWLLASHEATECHGSNFLDNRMDPTQPRKASNNLPGYCVPRKLSCLLIPHHDIAGGDTLV